jgi:glutaminyl-tRNA synthetase
VKTIVTASAEPNDICTGHAKAICLNFGVAEEYRGRCHLRFDDTNPAKEEQEFIDAIQRDVRWLGFDWGEHLYHASDYFEQLYEWAEYLIREGKAYVDDTPSDQMRSQRGTLTEPGQNSPDRYRSIEENLDLFRRMRAGEFPNGARVLRAKIDMASPNINLRDPVLYRILHAEHPRTGNTWCIYQPMTTRMASRTRSRHHALAVHLGSRTTAAVRLVDREPAGAVASAPVRVRASQHRLYRDVSAS